MFPIVHFHLLTILVALIGLSHATVTFTILADETDAFNKIQAAMTAAANRWNRLIPRRNKIITVSYNPAVATAEGGWDDYLHGHIIFGGDHGYMNEQVALHEIAHTMGIGSTNAWTYRCSVGEWPRTDALLRSWLGDAAPKVECFDEFHMKPYGMNTPDEASEDNMNRHVQVVDVEIQDCGLGLGDGTQAM